MAALPRFTCVGSVDDPEYHRAASLLNGVVKALSAQQAAGESKDAEEEKEGSALELTALLEPEWEVYLVQAQQELGGAAFAHETSPLVTMVYPMCNPLHTDTGG